MAAWPTACEAHSSEKASDSFGLLPFLGHDFDLSHLSELFPLCFPFLSDYQSSQSSGRKISSQASQELRMCQINASKRRLFLNAEKPLEIYMTAPRQSDTSIPQLGLLNKQLIFYPEWKNHTHYGSLTLFNLNTAASFLQQRNLLGECDLWINPCMFSGDIYCYGQANNPLCEQPWEGSFFQQPHRPVNVFLHHCHTYTAKGENKGSKKKGILSRFHLDYCTEDCIHVYKIYKGTLKIFNVEATVFW